MVMAVKDANIISNLEFVSKSKVRGMLSLLKHCHVLLTQVKGPGEQPGYLYLAQAVTSFQVMRDWHDDYLLKFMQKLPLTLPESYITEMVWRYNNQEKFLRLENVEKLMHKLSSFFTGYLNSVSNKPAMYQHSMTNRNPAFSKPRPQRAPYPAQQPMNGGYPPSQQFQQQQYDDDEDDGNWSSRKPTMGAAYQQPSYSSAAPFANYREPHGTRGPVYGNNPRGAAPPQRGYPPHADMNSRYQEQQGYGGDKGMSRYRQLPASAYPQGNPSQYYSEASGTRRSIASESQSDGWMMDSSPQQLGSTHFNEALDTFDGRPSAQSYAVPRQSPASKPSFQGLLDPTEELSRSFFSGTRVSSELSSAIIGSGLESIDRSSSGPPELRRGDAGRVRAGWMEVQNNHRQVDQNKGGAALSFSTASGGFGSAKLSANAPIFGVNNVKPASSSSAGGLQGSTVFHDAWNNGDA